MVSANNEYRFPVGDSDTFYPPRREWRVRHFAREALMTSLSYIDVYEYSRVGKKGSEIISSLGAPGRHSG